MISDPQIGTSNPDTSREVSGFSMHESGPATSADAAPSPVRLGNNADLTSAPDADAFDIHAFLPPPETVKAYHLRSCGRELLKSHGISRRMRWCGSKISRNSDGVTVWARPDRAYGRLQGVCVCGQSICCPVCAPRIAAFRGSEVAQAYNNVGGAFQVVLETFTFSHHLSYHPLALLREIEEFSRAFAHLSSGRRSIRAGEGRKLSISAREVNWSWQNGWHFHLHRLGFYRPGCFDPDRTRADWLSSLQRVGRYTDYSPDRAYHSGEVKGAQLATYVSKLSLAVDAQSRAVGLEISGSANKGRNLNSLLLDHVQGVPDAARVWIDGVSVLTARKVSSVRWSRGGRALVGLEDKSDEQIAADEVTSTDYLLGSLSPLQWRTILRNKAEFCLLVAANKGRDYVNEFLSGLGAGQLDQPALGSIEEIKERIEDVDTTRVWSNGDVEKC